MKNIKYTTPLFIVFFMFLFSCEDFLEISPQGELTQEAFPVLESDALLATNAVYSVLRQWHYHSGGYPILDILSDDAHKGSNPNDQLSTLGPYDDFTITVTQDGLDRWWNALYEGIKRCNVVIEKVPEIDMDENTKNDYVGQAKFIRALLYFDLARAWGGVPLVTTTSPPLRLERATREQVYAIIEEDLLFAMAHLSKKSELSKTDIGRATKGAANALLGKVYLYQNSFPDAETYLAAVVNSNEYDLEPIFADANSVNGEQGIESVYEIGAIGAGNDGGGNQYANTMGVRGTPNRGWGFCRPSIDLREAFDANDPRLDATIIELGETLDGVEILGDGTTPDEVTDEFGNVIEIESYNQKIWTPGTSTASQFGHNRRLIRYADVLLMYAEVLNENNKSGEALKYLNMVRERAREGNNNILPDITETNKDALRDLILKERRLELALEGHRFWDLVRTGKANAVLGPLGFIPEKHELFPVPQTEIDISQGSLTQNPNWNE